MTTKKYYSVQITYYQPDPVGTLKPFKKISSSVVIASNEITAFYAYQQYLKNYGAIDIENFMPKSVKQVQLIEGE